MFSGINMLEAQIKKETLKNIKKQKQLPKSGGCRL